MQACGNGKRWRRDRSNRALGLFLATRLKYRLGHLLDEKGNTIGALYDVLPNTCEQRLVAGNTVDHGSDFALPKPIKSEGWDGGPPNPRGFKFGAIRDDQQYGKGSYPFHRSTERFKAGGIGPVRILENHQHRASLRKCLYLCYKCFKYSLSALVWG